MEDQSPQTPNNNLQSPPPANNLSAENPDVNDIGLPPPPKPRFQFRSSIIWVVLVVIIIGLFFAGYSIGGLSKNNQVKSFRDQIEKLEEDKNKLNDQVTDLEETVGDLDRGIIYIPFKNYKHEYQFFYPTDLILIDYTEDDLIPVFALEKDNQTIAIFKSGLYEYPEDEYLGQKSSKSLKISEQNATKHEFPEGTVVDGNKSDPFVAYRTTYKKVQYVLEFYGSTELSDTQERIFNQFEFIKITKPNNNVFGF
ncbi:MAG: hypothetical protein ABH837_03835 [bacterium]